MSTVNKIILVGTVGQDPTINKAGETKVANLSLATSEKYTKKNGEKVDTTEWHRLTLWSGLADIVEKYVKKGSKLYAEGKVQTRKYTDKEGNERSITEVICDKITLLDSKPTDKAKTESVEVSTDDLPF
jgi:single-strand DNA-binding protein